MTEYSKSIPKTKIFEKSLLFLFIIAFNIFIFLVIASQIVYHISFLAMQEPMVSFKVKPATPPPPPPKPPTHGGEASNIEPQANVVPPPVSAPQVIATSTVSMNLNLNTKTSIDPSILTTLPSDLFPPSGASLGQQGTSGGGVPQSNPFGSTSADGGGSGLQGYFYHLMFKRDGSPAHMTGEKYLAHLYDYIDKGFPDNYFNEFSQGSHPLYLNQLVVPNVPFGEAYKAFCDRPLQDPHCWVADYKGNFTVPHSGTFRFVGYANDLTSVAINNKLVFYAVINTSAGVNKQTTERYNYTVPDHPDHTFSCPCGDWVKLEQNIVYHMEIFIGDDTGESAFFLLVQEQNRNYLPAPGIKSPLLPLLRFSREQQPVVGGYMIPYDNNEDIGWSVVGDNYKPGDTVPDN